GDAVGAGDPGRAAGRPGEADEDLDRRRLAGPVGPDESHDLPALDGHREVVQCHQAAVLLRQALGFDDGLVTTHEWFSDSTVRAAHAAQRSKRAGGRLLRCAACAARTTKLIPPA